MTPEITYGKIPTDIARQLKPMARALLITICCEINRQKNRLECSLSQLAEWSGMSIPTVINWTRKLEEADILEVKRDEKPGNHKAMNVYSLRGIVAEVACYNGKKDAERGKDALPHTDEGVKEIKGRGKKSLEDKGGEGVKEINRPLNEKQKEKGNTNDKSNALISFPEKQKAKSQKTKAPTATRPALPETSPVAAPPAPALPVAAEPAAPQPQPDPALDTPASEDKTAAQVWALAQLQFELQYPHVKHAYAELRLTGYENGVFVLEAATPYAYQTYGNGGNVRAVLRDVMGIGLERVRVRCTLAEAKPLRFGGVEAADDRDYWEGQKRRFEALPEHRRLIIGRGAAGD